MRADQIKSRQDALAFVVAELANCRAKIVHVPLYNRFEVAEKHEEKILNTLIKSPYFKNLSQHESSAAQNDILNDAKDALHAHADQILTSEARKLKF